MISGLTVGRIVHYVLDDGECRAAMIVRVWDKESGCANLAVFRDGSNDNAVLCRRANDTVPHTQCQTDGHHDNPPGWPMTFWATSALFADPAAEFPKPKPKPKHHTWHWPERE